MTVPQRLYMTPKEVAAYLGMSSCWIYRRIRFGGGPPFRRRGSRILYLREDVERWDKRSMHPRKPRAAQARLKRLNSIDSHVT